MLATMRQLQLMGMEAKSNELEAVLHNCTRYRVSVGVTYVETHVTTNPPGESIAESLALLGSSP